MEEEIRKQYEIETGKKWFTVPFTRGEQAFASWGYQLWLEKKISQVEPEVKKNEIEQQIFEKMKAKDFGESMCNETKLNVLKWTMQQLRKHDVIHWVAVKDAQPARRDLAYLTYDESGFMTWRYWKDTFWEGEHIVNEPKVTHWTIVQPPCV